MTKTAQWFDVDKKGLGKLMERRGKKHILFELLANAWDQNVTEVNVTIVHDPGETHITVQDDDPEGFMDLAHAYTLFAESTKGKNPEKRGRFNMGDKLAFAACDSATVCTTKGMVTFDHNGRTVKREKRLTGSCVSVTFKCNQDEHQEILDAAQELIPPIGIKTTIFDRNFSKGNELIRPTVKATFGIPLLTEYADEEGVLRRSTRQTLVEVFEADPFKPRIYEMGIPVVESDMPWHVNVHQRVPLNMDRDNVTPAYARALHVAVLNNCAAILTQPQAAKAWVTDAICDKTIEPVALDKVLTDRYGTKRVSFDPTDLEANSKAMSEGYKVVHGGSLPAEVWQNIRDRGGIKPASRIFPTKAIETSSDGYDPSVPESEWSHAMHLVVDFVHHLSKELLGYDVPVDIVKLRGKDANVRAAFDPAGGFWFNLNRLGVQWFGDQASTTRGPGEDLIGLILHELGHAIESNHLDARYFRALTTLGARLAIAVANGKIMWQGKPWRTS